MARFLAVQLARIGDLAQTRRLLAGLWRQAEKTGGGGHRAAGLFGLTPKAREQAPGLGQVPDTGQLHRQKARHA
ncbi:hypothetical protein, partial [Solidesulfovibrio sp.]|uniref:hypothetical protein n=1 Tax=Solidesulfovibrio sp. TaxID=2910990 RepID=UPI002B1FC3F5